MTFPLNSNRTSLPSSRIGGRSRKELNLNIIKKIYAYTKRVIKCQTKKEMI